MRFVSVGMVILLSFFTSQGQEISEKKFDHYASIQVNQLLKEIINLNENSIIVENPFFLNYSLIKTKNGFGVRAGFGYLLSKSQDHENPDADLFQQSELAFRVGLSKRIIISRKCELECSVDFVDKYNLTKSYSNVVTEFGTNSDSSFFQSKSTEKTIGGGFCVAFRYSLSKRILIGTETSYYMLSTLAESHSQVFSHKINFSSETYSIEVENASTDNTDVSYQLPVAIFISFKF